MIYLQINIENKLVTNIYKNEISQFQRLSKLYMFDYLVILKPIAIKMNLYFPLL